MFYAKKLKAAGPRGISHGGGEGRVAQNGKGSCELPMGFRVIVKYFIKKVENT